MKSKKLTENFNSFWISPKGEVFQAKQAGHQDWLDTHEELLIQNNYLTQEELENASIEYMVEKGWIRVTSTTFVVRELRNKELDLIFEFVKRHNIDKKKIEIYDLYDELLYDAQMFEGKSKMFKTTVVFTKSSKFNKSKQEAFKKDMLGVIKGNKVDVEVFDIRISNNNIEFDIGFSSQEEFSESLEYALNTIQEADANLHKFLGRYSGTNYKESKMSLSKSVTNLLESFERGLNENYKFSDKEEQIEQLEQFYQDQEDHAEEMVDHEDTLNMYLEGFADELERSVKEYLNNKSNKDDSFYEMFHSFKDRLSKEELQKVYDIIIENLSVDYEPSIRRIENSIDSWEAGEKEIQFSGLYGEVNGKEVNDIHAELTKGLTEEEIKQAQRGFTISGDLLYYYAGGVYHLMVDEDEVKQEIRNILRAKDHKDESMKASLDKLLTKKKERKEPKSESKEDFQALLKKATKSKKIKKGLKERFDNPTLKDYPELDEQVIELVKEAIKKVESKYDGFGGDTIEAIDTEHRDGYMPHTDGGYTASTFIRWYKFEELPVKIQDKFPEYMKQTYETIFDQVKEKFPEELKDVTFNDFYYTDYEKTNPEIYDYYLEVEQEVEDDILLTIQVMFYNYEENLSFTVQGIANIEHPYFRPNRGNESFYEAEIDFTKEEIPTVIEKVKAEVNKAVDFLGA